MMPHAIRRVYVARRARTAASVAIALIGAMLLVVAATPTWAAFLARGMPGINPGILCTLVVAMWLVGMFAYVAARAIDEHRFAVAMSRLVMPGADLNEDLERLAHEHPDQAAREMAHRLEVRSAALPVLAAGVLLPVTALYVAAAFQTAGWPVIASFEASIAHHTTQLVACAGLGTVLAVAVTKRAVRLPVVAPTMAILALICGGIAGVFTPWLAPVALLLAVIGLVARRLRIERELLEAEDPAAGSEIFTIRGALRRLGSAASTVLARVRGVRPVWVLVAGLLVIAGVTATKLLEVKGPPPPPPQLAASTPRIAKPAIAPSGSRSSIEPMGRGVLKVVLDLVDDQPIEIPGLAALAAVPAGWQARVSIRQLEGLSLQVSLAGGSMQPVSIGSEIRPTTSSCGIEAEPFELRIQGAPGHYVLYAEPVLTPADCAGSMPYPNY